MTTKEYLKALQTLGLGVASQRTAEVLGVSLRQAQYYAAGSPIGRQTELLLAMYLMFGIPDCR